MNCSPYVYKTNQKYYYICYLKITNYGVGYWRSLFKMWRMGHFRIRSVLLGILRAILCWICCWCRCWSSVCRSRIRMNSLIWGIGRLIILIIGHCFGDYVTNSISYSNRTQSTEHTNSIQIYKNQNTPHPPSHNNAYCKVDKNIQVPKPKTSTYLYSHVKIYKAQQQKPINNPISKYKSIRNKNTINIK